MEKGLERELFGPIKCLEIKITSHTTQGQIWALVLLPQG